MKKNLTLLFAILLVGAFQLNAQNIVFGGAGDPNGEFDGGLNDWKTIGLGTCALDSNDNNAAWIWSEDGTMSQGAFWGARTPIVSPSVANGAAGFNSDFYDNTGNGTFGAGLCPAPHVGVLETPVIDCSSLNDGVFLWFYQYWREFFAEAEIHVSNNGGMTFDNIYIVNEDIEVNQESRNTVVLDITDAAAGASEVVIRFVFDGTLCNANGCGYYYWLIDDVEVSDRNSLANSLALVQDDNSFQPFFPFLNTQAPSCITAKDTFGFSAGVTVAVPASGLQVDDVTNAVISAVVEQLNPLNGAVEDTLFSVDTLVGTVSLGDTIFTNFGGALWAPEVGEGRYRVRYRVSCDQDDLDFITSDNTHSGTRGEFLVDDSVDPAMTKNRGIGSASRWNVNNSTDFWYVGNVFDIPNYNCNNVTYFTNQFEFCAAWNDFAPYEMELFIVEVSADAVANGYENFDFSGELTENDGLTILGQIPFTYESDDQGFAALREDMTDFFGEYIELQPGTTYWVLARYKGEDIVFHCWDDNAKLPLTTGVLWYDDTDLGFRWFFTGNLGQANVLNMTLTIDIDTKADEVLLPENTFNLYPNPVINDQLTISLDFDQATDGMIVIYDQNGKVLSMREHKGMMDQTLTTDVYMYAPGVYFVRMMTDEGSLTKEFVIQR